MNMKKIFIFLSVIVFMFVFTGCENTDMTIHDESSLSETLQYETDTPKLVETTSNENEEHVADTEPLEISIKTPFAPKPGNVIRISHSFRETLFFTKDSIWKTFNAWSLTEPVRMMDTIENIDRVIENTHILTTAQTLYFLDFDYGQVVKQLENISSLYHWHIGTGSNPLRYAQTTDGSKWRVDTAEPIRLPDDTVLECIKPREESISSDILDLWFDEVRDVVSGLVLTENNMLWWFRRLGHDDDIPVKIMENVLSIRGGIITLDNELWILSWETDTPQPYFIMENVKSIENGLIITLNNELWGYNPRGSEPFLIMNDVKSVQGFFGFIAFDDTLWWLPDWFRLGREHQNPVKIKENVLRTWWNWFGSEYIITIDGSLWLFNYEDLYFVQIFQGTDLEQRDENQFTEIDIDTLNWIDLGAISIPSIFHYEEVGLHGSIIITGDILNSRTGVQGDNFMYVGWLKGDFEEFVDYAERFVFDDGHSGLFIKSFDFGTMGWIREDGNLITFRHGGDVSIFTEYKELIMQIVRSLR